MLLDLASSHKVLFFGGKVLLVSTDPAHNLGHLFARPVGPSPVRITAGLEAIELDPNESVETHIKEVSQALHQLMPVTQHGEIDKHMALSRDAPEMHEAALLERIVDIVQDGLDSYGLIVFDTAALAKA